MGKVLWGKPGGASVNMGMLTKERSTKSAHVLGVSVVIDVSFELPLVGLFVDSAEVVLCIYILRKVSRQYYEEIRYVSTA